MQGDLLTSFYDSVVAFAIFYGVVCWSSSISAADKRRLDKLKSKIKKARSILGSSGAGGEREQDDGQAVIAAGEGVQPAGPNV